MQSAFHAMNSQDLMNFFENLDLPLKTEQGKRVFPVSDKAGHVTDALANYMQKAGVKVKLNCIVHGVACASDARSKFIIHTDAGQLESDLIIIATGGLSYPSTGSTGDGYGFARNLGHTIEPTHPSLVPLVANEPWVKELEGLSLRNVSISVDFSACNARRAARGRSPHLNESGEMLFTHTGVSGPLILCASAYLTDKLPAKLQIDLKPGLTHEQLDTRMLRDFSENQNKDFANALDGLLPKRLIETIIKLSEIPPDKKVHAITRSERQSLVTLLKGLTITATKTTGYKEAVITKGGVNVKEVNPSTLMSKKIPGLFFAGEVLDVDALTGGYNLQIAFSTGYLAGRSAGRWEQ